MPYNVIGVFKKVELEVKEQPTPEWLQEDFTEKVTFKFCIDVWVAFMNKSMFVALGNSHWISWQWFLTRWTVSSLKAGVVTLVLYTCIGEGTEVPLFWLTKLHSVLTKICLWIFFFLGCQNFEKEREPQSLYSL